MLSWRCSLLSPKTSALPGRNLHGAAALIVLLLVLWPFFSSGLYDEAPQIYALWHGVVGLGVVLLLGVYCRRPLTFTPARLAALALTLAYMASILVAVSPRAAIQEVFKYSLYFLVFLTVSEVIRLTEARKSELTDIGGWLGSFRGMVTALWTTAVIVVIISFIGGLTGLADKVFLVQRFYTLIYYPNSAGSLLGAAFLVGLGLRRLWPSRGRVVDILLSIGQWALLAGFFLTMSRGAWLVMPIAFAVVLILWPAGRRFAAIGEVAITGVAALALAPLLYAGFGRPLLGLPALVAGMSVAAGAGWLIRKYEALPARRQIILAVSAVVGVAVVFGVLLAAGALPDTLVDRLSSFSLSQRSAWERIAWTGDAFKIVEDHPVLGVGGGGWPAIYREYQSYGYYTKEVHNDFLEIWAETGTIGLIAFLSLLVTSVLAFFGLARNRGTADPAGRALVAALAGGAAMLVVHSALDFNLALGCVGVFLWALLGAADGAWLAAREAEDQPDRAARRHEEKRRGDSGIPAIILWPRVGLFAVVLAVAILAGVLGAGIAAARQAEQHLAELDLAAGLEAYERACSLDPWQTSYRMELADLYERTYEAQNGNNSGSNADVKYLVRVRQLMEEAIDLEPTNPNHHALYGAFALRHGGFDFAIEHITLAWDLNPFEATRYQQLGEMNFLLGRYYITQDDLDAARQYLEEAVGVPDLMAEQSAKVPDYVPKNMTLPEVTPMVALHAGQSLCLLGRYDEAQDRLEFAYESGLSKLGREDNESVQTRKAEAALWLSVLADMHGDTDAAAAYLEVARPVVVVPEQLIKQIAPFFGAAAPDASSSGSAG